MSVAPVALIPLRSFDAGKSRLSGLLDVAQRQALIEAMMTDVVAAVSNAGVTDFLVATCGDHAAGVAARLGVPAVHDATNDGGLNRALSAAVATLSCERVLIVAADLPRVTAADITAVMHADTPVVVAKTHDDGTAVLAFSPLRPFGLAYGPQSAVTHAVRAQADGQRVSVLERAGLMFDLDTPEDLTRAYRQVAEDCDVPAVGVHTRRVLAGLPRSVVGAATLPPSA